MSLCSMTNAKENIKTTKTHQDNDIGCKFKNKSGAAWYCIPLLNIE